MNPDLGTLSGLGSSATSISGLEAVARQGLVWQFSGQGTLSVGVLKELFETEPCYREALAACDVILTTHLGFNATEVLYPVSGDSSISDSQAEAMLSETRYSQAILVSLEYSLSQVWLSRGISPSAVMGHSLGEYAACLVAGVLSLEDCLRIVCERGRLMQESEACVGSVVIVKTTSADIVAAVEEVGASSEVSLAAVNGARSVVVSGSQEGVDSVLRSSVLSGIEHRTMKMSRAFHSPLMANISDDFEKVLLSVKLRRPSIRVISTVTGGYVDEELICPSYWLQHMMQPVLYHTAVEFAIANEIHGITNGSGGMCTIVEMGADSTLCRLSRRILEHLREDHSLSSSKITCLSGWNLEEISLVW